MSHPFSENDIEQAKTFGITEQEMLRQLAILRQGLVTTEAVRACVLGDGIHKIHSEDHARLIERFERARLKGRFTKLVPASGAATRMFKFVFNKAQNPDQENPDFDFLLDHLEEFPFFERLCQLCKPSRPKDMAPEKLAKMMLEDLNFSTLPKAFIPFHAYDSEIYMAIDEHFSDATLYLVDQHGMIRLHFTIDPQFVPRLEEEVKRISDSSSFQYQVSHSIQKPQTQTIAVFDNGKPARTQDGRLLFRPGGHGSLLENLKDLQRDHAGDIVFIQNIDNVGRKEHHPERVQYKKLLAGYLLEIEDQVRAFLNQIEKPELNLDEAWSFARHKLGVQLMVSPETLSDADQRKELKSILLRPIRVCGMVKNEGEPGGGPFWTRSNVESCQILEKAQLDLSDPKQKEILGQSTHFNPVDLVCSLRDPNGSPFDLDAFIDPNACFISEKSFNGETIFALEHPGLWNGAMAHWNTAFVEVPLLTFTPVKTVNDLTRASHQP